MTSLNVLHDCATIQLTQGKNTLIDAADLPIALVGTWHAWTCPTSRTYYAVRFLCVAEREGRSRHERTKLHRLILGATPGVFVDHKDLDGLNNTRENLRFCTPAQNAYNRRAFRGRKAKFKGIARRGNRWAAYVAIKAKKRYLGCFLTQEDAARAYDAAAIRLHGEFACTNEKIYGRYWEKDEAAEEAESN